MVIKERQDTQEQRKLATHFLSTDGLKRNSAAPSVTLAAMVLSWIVCQ